MFYYMKDMFSSNNFSLKMHITLLKKNQYNIHGNKL